MDKYSSACTEIICSIIYSRKNPTITLQIKYSLTNNEKISNSFRICSVSWQDTPYGILMTGRLPRTVQPSSSPLPVETTAPMGWSEETDTAWPGVKV